MKCYSRRWNGCMNCWKSVGGVTHVYEVKKKHSWKGVVPFSSDSTVPMFPKGKLDMKPGKDFWVYCRLMLRPGICTGVPTAQFCEQLVHIGIHCSLCWYGFPNELVLAQWFQDFWCFANAVRPPRVYQLTAGKHSILGGMPGSTSRHESCQLAEQKSTHDLYQRSKSVCLERNCEAHSTLAFDL